LSPQASRVRHSPGCGIIRAVARVVFTQQLRRFTETPEVQAAAPTLHGALEAAFAVNPRLRGYVLDDQGHLRANVVVFVDGQRSRDRIGQGDALQPDSQVYVLQALSGG
jgi:hypothetical protein